MWSDLRTAVCENENGNRFEIRFAKNDNGEIWAFEGEAAEQVQDDSETAVSDIISSDCRFVEWK